WRRHRAGPSARRHGHPPDTDAGERAGAVRRALWHRLGLYRWWPGHRPAHREHRGHLMEISGRTAFVTGGGSGLGAATARALASAGARVAIFDRDTAKGTAIAKEVGGRFFACDVADAAAAE